MKKVFIACFFTILMLLVPVTSVAKTPDIPRIKNFYNTFFDTPEIHLTKNQLREINDFIEYWIPKFNDFKYYCIYPQNSDIINSVIEINFSHEPDNLLRLFYVVKLVIL